MAATSVARKLKRARRPAVAAAVTTTAAAVAASLALTSAPPATAAPLNVEQQVLTAGPILDLLPIFGILLIGAVLVNLMQIGFLFLPQKLAPDVGRLYPLQGLRRVFSLTNLARLVMVDCRKPAPRRICLHRRPETA